MKPFILALASLILTVTIIAVNGVFTARTCKSLLESIESAPEVTDDNMDAQAAYFQEFKNKWDSDKKFITISVNHRVTEEIDGYVVAITAACEAGDAGQYEVNKEKMAAALENLRGLATVNLENII